MGHRPRATPLPAPRRALLAAAADDRAPGDEPALPDPELADVVAFLKTLDDGFAP